MEPFEFHAELFDVRSAVLDHLTDNGFVWLSDFGAVDLQHDVYGLEVTAIREKRSATAIEQILRKTLPDWHFAQTYYEDQNIGELGWKVMISKQPESSEDKTMVAMFGLETVADLNRKDWPTRLIESVFNRLRKRR